MPTGLTDPLYVMPPPDLYEEGTKNDEIDIAKFSQSNFLSTTEIGKKASDVVSFLSEYTDVEIIGLDGQGYNVMGKASGSGEGAAGGASSIHPWTVIIKKEKTNPSDPESETIDVARWLITSRVYDSPIMALSIAGEVGNSKIVTDDDGALVTSYVVYAILKPLPSRDVEIILFTFAGNGYQSGDPEIDDLNITGNGGSYNFGTEQDPEWGFAKRIVTIGWSPLFNKYISVNDVTSHLAVVLACNNGEVRPAIISI